MMIICSIFLPPLKSSDEAKRLMSWSIERDERDEREPFRVHVPQGGFVLRVIGEERGECCGEIVKDDLRAMEGLMGEVGL